MSESSTDEETPLTSVAVGLVTFLTLTVAFGLMFVGVPYFWVAFPIGFGGGIPLAASLAKWYESRQPDRSADESGSDDTEDALAALRDRYARGEIDDTEFERRVERLLETESIDDAETFLSSTDASADSPTGSDHDRDETVETERS